MRKRKRKEVDGYAMYNVLDVCYFVIDYSNSARYGMSCLKLQKILYFIQAYFLILPQKRRCCFRDKIEAWDFGPVVPAAYNEFKQFGSGNIPSVDSRIIVDKNNIWNFRRVAINKNVISFEDKELIIKVVDVFSNYSATDLVTITHRQGPWINAFDPNCFNEITPEAIQAYFDQEP